MTTCNERIQLFVKGHYPESEIASITFLRDALEYLNDRPEIANEWKTVEALLFDYISDVEYKEYLKTCAPKRPVVPGSRH